MHFIQYTFCNIFGVASDVIPNEAVGEGDLDVLVKIGDCMENRS